jgi:tetratricopeptide (TPR) repeat protein
MDVLINLEMLRRRTEITNVARIIAETWILLEMFPSEEMLHEWAAWYFDLQRSRTESDMLLRTVAARQGFTGQWLNIHRALSSIRDGDLDTAESLLAPIASDNWTAQANFGRILESRRAPARAIENYERALEAVLKLSPAPDGWQQVASQIQLRIAFCLRAMGRASESQSALEYALELDPDNLVVRFELNRAR